MVKPFTAFPLGAQIRALYSQNGEGVENVFHLSGTSAWTPTTLTSVITAYAGWETAHARSQRNTSTELFSVTAIDLSARDSFAVSQSEAIVGTVASEPLPNNVTIAIKHNTAKRGRSFRGRTFWIGLCEAQRDAVAHNAVDSSAASALLTTMAFLRDVTWPNGGVLCVASRYNNKVQLNPGVLTPVTTFTFVDQIFDSQRRRLPAHNVHR